VCVCVCVFS
jgi:hypothetical protein